MNELPILFYYEHRFINTDRAMVLVYGTSLEHCILKLQKTLKRKPESYQVTVMTILPDQFTQQPKPDEKPTDGNKAG